jgi:tripeptidyl-peptidase-1
VVHEKRDTPHSHSRIRLDNDAIIPIRIALRQNNLHTGHDYLMDVSHPSSKNYGKHWTAEEVHDHFAPSEEAVQAVKDWLLSSGLHEHDIFHYENKGWLAMDIPASHAEHLLETDYYEYEKSGSYHIGCDAYSLPAHIAEHVDFIKPGVKLSAPLNKRTVKRDSTHWPRGHPGRPQPPHIPAHRLPHYQPPPHAQGLAPDLRDCGVNIT